MPATKIVKGFSHWAHESEGVSCFVASATKFLEEFVLFLPVRTESLSKKPPIRLKKLFPHRLSCAQHNILEV